MAALRPSYTKDGISGKNDDSNPKKDGKTTCFQDGIEDVSGQYVPAVQLFYGFWWCYELLSLGLQLDLFMTLIGNLSEGFH